MYYYDEMSVDEIAQAMGCPSKTVSSRLHSSREKIKEAVLIYEKKSGDRLHMLMPVPILTEILRKEAASISVPDYGRYDGENTVGLYSITPHFDYHFVTKDEKGIKTNSEKLLERLKKDPKSEYESIEEFECGGRKWFGYKFKEPLGVTGVYVDAFTAYTVGEGDNSLEVTGLSTAYDTDLSKDMLEAVKVVKEKK